MTERKPIDGGRRAFLKTAAAMTATLLAPGVTLYAMGEAAAAETAPASSKVRWGLLIDASKCKEGCSACITACSKAFGWESTGHPETDPQWVRKVTAKDPRTGAGFSVPVMCQHCANRALRGCLPYRRFVQTRGRHRAGGPPHLHRLPLLHDGLPLQGAVLRA